jgi:ABC-type Fe3+-hydroxamate transport system substrate-binding protein
LVERWNAAGKRVVIYGAGEHTARLFQWTTLSQARLIGLVDSNTTLHGQVRWDLKIHPPEQIRNLNPDVILISSQMWQEEIYRSLAPLESAGIEVVRLYQP